MIDSLLQYVFDIPGEDIIMISLEQDDTHIGRSGSDESAMEIGFHVMKVGLRRFFNTKAGYSNFHYKHKAVVRPFII